MQENIETTIFSKLNLPAWNGPSYLVYLHGSFYSKVTEFALYSMSLLNKFEWWTDKVLFFHTLWVGSLRGLLSNKHNVQTQVNNFQTKSCRVRYVEKKQLL